jgi:hypothetical protein
LEQEGVLEQQPQGMYALQHGLRRFGKTGACRDGTEVVDVVEDVF